MAIINNGTVNIRLKVNRRLISSNSGFSSPKTTVRASKAIPQAGHEPGDSSTTSGCIGQIYSVFLDGGTKASGSNAIPHFGQISGLSLSTPGHIGQIYLAPGTILASVRG